MEETERFRESLKSRLTPQSVFYYTIIGIALPWLGYLYDNKFFIWLGAVWIQLTVYGILWFNVRSRQALALDKDRVRDVKIWLWIERLLHVALVPVTVGAAVTFWSGELFLGVMVGIFTLICTMITFGLYAWINR